MTPESLEWHEWLAVFWFAEAEKRRQTLERCQAEITAAERAQRDHELRAYNLREKAR